MKRFCNILGTIVIGLLVLLAPAGRACLALQPMAEDCPMPRTAELPDRSPSERGHAQHAMGRSPAAENHRQQPAATAPAAPCHDEQEPAAACCRTERALGQVEAASFGSTAQPNPPAAQPGGWAIDALAPSRAIVNLGTRRKPPEPPRYELHSSYLL